MDSKSLFTWTGGKVELLGAFHNIRLTIRNEILSRKIKPDHIYIVDFSFSKDDLKLIAEQIPITILDHHVTAKDDLECLLQDKIIGGIFDMEKAGCQIVWDHFYTGIPRPWFVDYVADRDLWQWKLEYSREINAGFHCMELLESPNDGKLDQLYKDNQPALENIYQTGINEINRRQMLITNLATEVSKSATFKVGNTYYRAVISDCPFENLRSDYGNYLLQIDKYSSCQLAFIYRYIPYMNTFSVSLRARMSDEIDVSQLAKYYGGGGHKAAAGLSLTPIQLSKLIKHI